MSAATRKWKKRAARLERAVNANTPMSRKEADRILATFKRSEKLMRAVELL